MAYEIDFIVIPGVKKDYDAIAFRYFSSRLNRFVVCVFDGGTTEVGEALSKHLSQYYLSPATANRTIDFVFCSHADSDHSAGLRTILEKHDVHYLVMNRPWLFVEELYEKVKDGRITRKSLEQHLRENYSFIDNLEKIAFEKHVTILDGFQNTKLDEALCICSPSRQSYLARLCESQKTPATDASTTNALLHNVVAFAKKMFRVFWGVDAIREGEQTTPENETSIVLRASPEGDNPFVLTADAGCIALKDALDFADAKGISLNQCSFVQMPHHGGRHNVSPSILNRLLGPIISQGTPPSKTSFVSVGEDSDHPRRCVVNAFMHRGCAGLICSTSPLHHHEKLPRTGWVPAKAELYSTEVESWEQE